MLVPAILFALISASYACWELGLIKNKTISSLLKDFADCAPCVLLLALGKPGTAWFLCLCLMANWTICDFWPMGFALFAGAYAEASIQAVWGAPLNLLNLGVCLGALLLAEVPLMILCKEKPAVKIGAGIYGFVSLAPCLYAFSVTFNPGFLCLALGDAGLGLDAAFGKKWIKITANFLYFAGLCLVPLSL